MSQRVDLNGNPAVGWLLYLYQANTSTPVSSYADQGLTILNPWPLVADSYGMVGQFWVADGSYRARATSSDGSLTYYDQQNILAIGGSTSSGGGGGGGTIDPSQIFQTGDLIWVDTQGTRTGWVRDNGRTLGSATSGATERANADCQNLFTFLWNTYGNNFCPVVGGRGASAAADWGVNKQITLPDKRGSSAFGLDDMGNTAAGRLASAPIVTAGGSVVLPGTVLGENTHTLLATEMPVHSHTGSGTTTGQSVDHTHTQIASASVGSYSAGGSTGPLGAGSQTGGTSNDHTHNFSFTTANAGSGGAANIVSRATLGTFYRKL